MVKVERRSKVLETDDPFQDRFTSAEGKLKLFVTDAIAYGHGETSNFFSDRVPDKVLEILARTLST